MMSRSPRLIEAGLALAIAAECIAAAWWRGIVFPADSRWYVRAGDLLLAHKFNVFDLYNAPWTDASAVCYTLLPLLIAVFKAIAPVSWPLLIFFANTAATAAAGVLTFRLAYSTIGATGAAAAAIGYLAAADVIDWARYMLTDSLFLGIATLATYLMTMALVHNAPRYASAAAGVQLVAIVTRPTAPELLVPFAIVLMVLWNARRQRAEEANELRSLTLGFLAVAPLILVLAVAALTFIARQHVPGALRLVIDLYRSGVVIDGRMETYTAGGIGFTAFLATLLRRIIAFFSITAKAFSRRHTIVSILYFVPLYAAAVAGVIALFARRRARPPAEIAAYVALLTTCTIWLSQALVIIDFDWRYRLPIMPSLLFLGAFGVASLKESLFTTSS